jgi:hypothetical protein
MAGPFRSVPSALLRALGEAAALKKAEAEEETLLRMADMGGKDAFEELKRLAAQVGACGGGGGAADP